MFSEAGERGSNMKHLRYDRYANADLHHEMLTYST